MLVFFLKWAKPEKNRPLFIYFYSTILTRNDTSFYGVVGTQTQGSKMVGADKSTELWRHPFCWVSFSYLFDTNRKQCDQKKIALCP